MLLYKEKLAKFNDVINEYEQYLTNLAFKRFIVDDFTTVFLIEDSFVMYIGMMNDLGDYNPNVFSYLKDDITTTFSIVFEELTYNDIFKFNATKFAKKIGGVYNFIQYKTFAYMQKTKKYNESYESKKGFIIKTLPELRLEDRLKNWSGVAYSFIVYELECHGKKGYATSSTTMGSIDANIRRDVSEIELEGIRAFVYKYGDGDVAKNRFDGKEFPTIGLYLNNTMRDILADKVHRIKLESGWNSGKRHGNGVLDYLEKELKYIVVKKYVKDLEKIHLVAYEIMQADIAGEYDSVERVEYLAAENRWKSEELMYTIIKKHFANTNVIYQYRPYFLISDKGGQMSYDVYVPDKRIAFEYQGKQHFEPIDFFGGVENHEQQKKRDKQKLKLSMEHGINLIYINYWESVTPELIVEKLKEASL